MSSPTHALARIAAVVSLVVPAVAQVDLDAARAELLQCLQRPAGTVIGQPQRDALAAFVQRYTDQDLGPLGYAKAMLAYLQRDVKGSAAAFDTFFATHDTIAHAEHRNIAGRVYLASLATAAREGVADEGLLRQRAVRATRNYDDLRTIARVTAPLFSPDSKVQDRAALRMALLRGAVTAHADDIALDEFAAALYANQPDPPERGARAAAATAKAAPADLDGKRAPPFTATHVVDVRAPELRRTTLALSDLAGRIVVLDFFATWCPPCRAGVTHLVELQRKHAAEIAIVGVTRAYGRGMDFADPTASKPDGGNTVSGLDEAAEMKVNQAFATAFGLNYPIAFIDRAVHSNDYHVTGIPTAFVIDRQGKVIGSVVGNQEDRLDALIERALRER